MSFCTHQCNFIQLHSQKTSIFDRELDGDTKEEIILKDRKLCVLELLATLEPSDVYGITQTAGTKGIAGIITVYYRRKEVQP